MQVESRQILCSITLGGGGNSAVYEIKWKNIAELGKTQMTVWRMRIACRIPKAKNTHSEYVILFLHCNKG